MKDIDVGRSASLLSGSATMPKDKRRVIRTRTE